MRRLDRSPKGPTLLFVRLRRTQSRAPLEVACWVRKRKESAAKAT